MKTPSTITDKINLFKSNLKALENLGLEIISDKENSLNDSNTQRGGRAELSRLLYNDRTRLNHALERIKKGDEIDRSKIGLIAEIVRRVAKL